MPRQKAQLNLCFSSTYSKNYISDIFLALDKFEFVKHIELKTKLFPLVNHGKHQVFSSSFRSPNLCKLTNILIGLHLSLRLFKIVRFAFVILEVFKQISQVFRKKSLKEYTGFIMMLFCFFDNHSCP